MNIPPLLITATIIFWGVESGHLVISLLLGVIATGAAYLPATWKLSDEDSVSVFDLTSVIFLTASVLIFLNVDKLYFLKTIIIWLPPVLLPPLVAQLSSKRESLVIGTRFGFKKKTVYKRATMDFKLHYLATCMLSAAMANSRSAMFFPCMGLLIFWFVYANRGRAFSPIAFILVFSVALGGGYFTFKGAEDVHDYVSRKTRSLIRGYFYGRHADPFQAHLSFGAIGRLKQSGDIVLRVTANESTPLLLRLASYESYRSRSWYSSQQFTYLQTRLQMWNILPVEGAPGNKATIDLYLPREKGLLPHPKGSYRVVGEMLYELEKKPDGVIKIVDGAPLVTYDVFYDPSIVPVDDEPTAKNLVLVDEDDAVLQKVTQHWKVGGMSPRQRLEMVRDYFSRGFSYSLVRQGRGGASTALENFLLYTKSGYCELYATATALLLRKLEIPTRYVTGFVASEKGWLEDKIIVRERHAHAWCEAYVDGRWQVVDTTPPDWFARENEKRSGLERVQDFFSFLRLKYDRYQIQTELNFRGVFSFIALVLAVILAFRIYRRMGKKVTAGGAARGRKLFTPADSPLYAVEIRLEELGLGRRKGESSGDWLMRLGGEENIEREVLKEMVVLHQRLRFDPQGLTPPEEIYFAEVANKWLRNHPVTGAGEN